MNQIRTFLVIAWLMVAFLLWQEWGKEQEAQQQPAPAIPATNQSLPQAQPVSALPSVSGQAGQTTAAEVGASIQLRNDV